jgi:uncharacterized protein HemX
MSDTKPLEVIVDDTAEAVVELVTKRSVNKKAVVVLVVAAVVVGAGVTGVILKRRKNAKEILDEVKADDRVAADADQDLEAEKAGQEYREAREDADRAMATPKVVNQKAKPSDPIKMAAEKVDNKN